MDKRKLPYLLLHDPQTGRAAAYTNNHRLIAAEASKKLIQFALKNRKHTAPFNPALHDPQIRQLPDWATAETLGRLEMVWIKRPLGDAPEELWTAIPPR